MSATLPQTERAGVLRRILDRLEHPLPHGEWQQIVGMQTEYWTLLRALVGREIEQEAAAAVEGEQLCAPVWTG